MAHKPNNFQPQQSRPPNQEKKTELRRDNATTYRHHTNVHDLNQYESKDSSGSHPQPGTADKPYIKSTGHQITGIITKQYRDESQRTHQSDHPTK